MNNCAARLRERGQNFFYEVRHAADERKIELRQRLEYMREPREGLRLQQQSSTIKSLRIDLSVKLFRPLHIVPVFRASGDHLLI